jgi:predicted protein tyrosine phosphatase
MDIKVKKIDILSYRDLTEKLTNEPNTHDVIYCGMSWSDPNNVCDIVKSKAKSCLILYFDDIEWKKEGYQEPTERDVKEAISWAKNRDHIIVSCRAGVSRSSAIAYCIKCSETTPEEATNILTKGHHYPNSLIVKLGSDLLNKPSMVTTIKKWLYLGE